MLEVSLKKQTIWGGPLGKIMVKQGYFSEDFLMEVLSTQLGLQKASVPIPELQQEIFKLIPKELILKKEFIPVKEDKATIIIITNNPLDNELIETLENLTSKKLIIELATEKNIKKVLRKFIDVPKKSAQINFDDSDFYTNKDQKKEITSFNHKNEESFYKSSKIEIIKELEKKILKLSNLRNKDIEHARVLEKLINLLKSKGYLREDIKTDPSKFSKISFTEYKNEFSKIITELLQNNLISSIEYFKLRGK
jgi:hypothetical protein